MGVRRMDAMGRISNGSTRGRPVFCRGKLPDGRGCGRKVATSGSMCYAHREQERRKRLAQAKAEKPNGPP